MNIRSIHQKQLPNCFYFFIIILGDDYMNCIFCKIINGDIPSYKVYEDDVVLAFLDIHPDSNGHTLIIPKKHFVELKDIEEGTLLHIMKVSKDIEKLLYDKLSCDGVTLVQNNGLPQEVKHYHLHLIPKYREKTSIRNIEEIHSILIN